jgi:rhomboid protease GluP
MTTDAPIDAPAVPSDDRAAIERPIDFRRLTSVLHNDFGLGGPGRIAIDDASVRVAGRRRRGIAREPVELAFPTAQVRDATSYGKLVWFFVDPAPGDPGPARRMVVYARNDADAQAIFDALPRRMSPERAQARAEQDAFLDTINRTTPRLLVTPALVAINIAVFVAMLAAGAGLWGGNPAVHIRWGANYGPATAAGEWWRLVTNTFLHFGLVHVALNMYALFDAGRLAERLFGPARFLALYLVSGVAGSVASLWWNPSVNSAGASGAVFGVIGALLVYSIDRRNGMPRAVMQDHRFTLLAFLVYSLAFGLMHTNVDNAAHVGGLVAGMLAALAWPRPVGAGPGGVSRGRFVVLLAVFVAGIAFAARYVIERADTFNEGMRFRLVAPRFLPAEQGLDVLTQRTIEALQRGRLTREAAAEQLGALASQWRQLGTELADIRLRAEDPLAELRTQMIRLCGLRADGLAQLAAGIEANDRERTQAALAVLVESQKAHVAMQRELARLRVKPPPAP